MGSRRPGGGGEPECSRRTERRREERPERAAGPRRPRGPQAWRRLGRLLPRDVRERIFEPAFYDLLRTWLAGGGARSGLSFGPQVIAAYARCVPLALPRLLVRERRLTRLGRLAVFAGAAALVILVLIVRTEPGVAYGP